MAGTKRYRGFITYSHADHAIARRLQGWLESYRIPLGVMVQIDANRRLGRFFRDEDEMPATADIGATVRGAIEDSESLIVVCSPASATSPWVNAEITHFRRTGRERRIFAVIVDGVPNADDPSQECFPPALRMVDSSDPHAMPFEPLGLDLRKESRTRVCARLAAGLLDLSFDDLWKREQRRQVIQNTGFATAGAVAAAAAISAGWAILGLSASTAERRSVLFAEAAQQLNNEGQHERAMLVALMGDPAGRQSLATSWFRPAGFPAAQAALERGYIGSTAIWAGQAPLDGMSDLLPGASRIDPSVTSVGMDPEGRVVVGFLGIGGSEDNDVRWWRTGGGKSPQDSIDRKTSLHPEFQILPGAAEILIVRDGHPAIVDIARWETTSSYADPDGEYTAAAAASPDGAWVVTATNGNRVLLWRKGAAEPERRFENPGNESFGFIAFSPDARFVVAGGWEFARLWRIDQRKPLQTFDVDSAVTAVAFSNDMKRLLIGLEDGSTASFDVADPALRYDLQSVGGSIRALMPLQGRRDIWVGSSNGALRLWTEDGFDQATTLLQAEDRIRSIAIAADGRLLATGSRDGQVIVRRLEPGLPDTSLTIFEGRPVRAMTMSPDNTQVLTASAEGALLRRSLARPDEPETLTPEPVRSGAMALSAGGRYLARGFADGAVKLWRVGEPEPVVSFVITSPELQQQRYSISPITRELLDPKRITQIAISPDGSHVVTSAPSETWAWWTSGGSATRLSAFGRGASTLEFSPDGLRILVGSERGATLALVDKPLGEIGTVLFDRATRSFETGSPVKAAAFSPDARYLLLGLDNSVVQLWSIPDQKPLQDFRAHAGSVLDVAFHPGGGYFASADLHGVVNLWRVGQQAPVRTYATDANWIAGLAFSPDGSRLLAGTDDGRMLIWRMDPILAEPPGRQVDLACEKLIALGMSELLTEDIQRFSILQDDLRDPCRKIRLQ